MMKTIYIYCGRGRWHKQWKWSIGLVLSRKPTCGVGSWLHGKSSDPVPRPGSIANCTAHGFGHQKVSIKDFTPEHTTPQSRWGSRITVTTFELSTPSIANKSTKLIVPTKSCSLGDKASSQRHKICQADKSDHFPILHNHIASTLHQHNLPSSQSLWEFWHHSSLINMPTRRPRHRRPRIRRPLIPPPPTTCLIPTPQVNQPSSLHQQTWPLVRQILLPLLLMLLWRLPVSTLRVGSL